MRGDESGFTGNLTVYDIELTLTPRPGLIIGGEYKNGRTHLHEVLGQESSWNGYMVMAHFDFNDVAGITGRYDYFTREAFRAIQSGGTRSVQIGSGRTGSQDIGLLARQIDYRGRLRNTCAAVHDDVHDLAVPGRYGFDVVYRNSVLRRRDARTQHGSSEGLYDLEAYAVVRHPDSYRPPLADHELRHVSRSFQNEGIGAGKQALHHAVRRIGDVLRVPGEVFQVGTDETERLPGGRLLDLVDPVDGLAVEYVATQSINRVGRIDDYAAPVQCFDDPVDMPFLGVFGVEM